MNQPLASPTPPETTGPRAVWFGVCATIWSLMLTVWPAPRARGSEVPPSRPVTAAERSVATGEVGFDQKLGQSLPVGLRFRQENGQTVGLGDLAAGRPLLLVLAYFECPSLCTLVLNGLFDGLGKVPYQAGRDFDVVVVSIDPKEKPALAAAKKKAYLARYPKIRDGGAIHFLTGEAPDIQRLAAAIGFRYSYDAASREYLHPAGMVAVTPDGVISRYLFGVSFPARDLRLSLVEAAQGQIGRPIDRFLLFCYRYDARAGTYSLFVQRLVQLGSAALALGLGLTIAWQLRAEALGRRRTAATTGGGP